ncbi:DUF4373 domain-containing protein [Paenibacillus gorillae]|uniref:DUF4373 domain-containing protein n=1 Tax=Paenibacillus gorillae TaxID=1243662 RepID=UPI0004B9229C|nr:DUF4373 domain-containing protein [Paenibacillus gorillae]
MAKEAFYFSHDSNARHDPNIKQMRAVYNLEGYAWYWVLIEMMRDEDGFKLSMQGKYIWNAYASELQCNAEIAEAFVRDCINEFKLFESDGHYFWSRSLLRRMEKRTKVSEKRSEAANKRWAKSGAVTEVSDSADTTALQMHEGDDANASKNDALKESKVKESKRNKKENKDNTFSAYTSNTELSDTLESFIEFRKKIKKPMTERAITLLLNELNKLASNDDDKIAILNQSILNSWQGIFALKEKTEMKFGRYNSPQKPSLSIVTGGNDDPHTIPPEKLEEMRRLARKLDGEDLPF